MAAESYKNTKKKGRLSRPKSDRFFLLNVHFQRTVEVQNAVLVVHVVHIGEFDPSGSTVLFEGKNPAAKAGEVEGSVLNRELLAYHILIQIHFSDKEVGNPNESPFKFRSLTKHPFYILISFFQEVYKVHQGCEVLV
jgi:hypothetical protein